MIRKRKVVKFMKCYSVKHKDKRVQLASSSGGAFTALSDVILSLSGKESGGRGKTTIQLI